MEENQLSQEQAVQALYNHTANLIIEKQQKPWEVKKQLIEEGISEEVATAVIDAVKKHYNGEVDKKARKNMIIGGLWCVGGLVVTIVTLMASSGGGTYVVAWGAIIFGAIQFFQGYNLSQKKIY